MPIGNGDFLVENIIGKLFGDYIINANIKGFENIGIDDFRLYKMDGTLCN